MRLKRFSDRVARRWRALVLASSVAVATLHDTADTEPQALERYPLVWMIEPSSDPFDPRERVDTLVLTQEYVATGVSDDRGGQSTTWRALA